MLFFLIINIKAKFYVSENNKVLVGYFFEH